MAPIGIAIIGSGIFVKSEHLPAVEKTPSLSLKAIFSRSLKSAEDTAALIKSGPAPELYSADAGSGRTYHDLLLREDVSAVIIALPILSQPEFIEAALAAGKHVLAEKPIAGSVAAGKKLLDYYTKISADKAVTLAIAENFRFTPLFIFARDAAAKLGRVTHFNIRVFSFIGSDGKYYKTPWRTEPGYQGGFLLDGGVHYAAASRLFLSGDNAVASVRAFSDQVHPHLPPIDTINAILKTRSGATGSYQHSAGTQLSAFAWDIGFEGGTVKAEGDEVTVTPKGGEKTVKTFGRTSGVSEEVAAWAEALTSGTPNALQKPEEALADLEFLELMFRSGDKNGELQTYELQ